MIRATEERISPRLSRAFIGVGSNIEPRLKFLEHAVRSLKDLGEVNRISSIYETAPVGDIPQPDYLNSVVEIKTPLGPLELARELKLLEKEIGRVERPRWHEREIDLDLLFYDDLILESPDFTIPHPEAHRRGFVLVPMNEIASDFEHPVLRKNMSDLVKSVDVTGVCKTELSLAEDELYRH